ncbi:hypothetical protein J7643_14375 [bacterium]|nr:hypothetical protein [bacterium]
MTTRIDDRQGAESLTLLLSAGPGAGKTSLLKRWLAEWGPRARYFKLTTGLGAPLQEALPGLFPEARAVFETFSKRFEGLNWGAALGLALEEALPDAALLLDDLHLAEEGPDWEALMALCRHFPPYGRLGLASRHHLPAIGRDEERSWDADHPDWAERPTLQDLNRLPERLVAKALALHLLDALPASAESFELVRRNVARPALDGRHALRVAWGPVAEEAFSILERPNVWRMLAEELWEQYGLGVRTPDEARVRAACSRLPAKAREVLEERWRPEPLPEAPAALRALLACPVLEDRLASHRHFRALSHLHASACAEGDAQEAVALADRLVALSTRMGFSQDLLAAHVARLDARMLSVVPAGIAPFLAIPAEAFAMAESLADYLRCLRDRAHLLGESGLAVRLEAIAEQVLGVRLPASSREPLVPALRIHAFGKFALLTADGSEPRFARRKALAFLALLTRHARGMFAEELAAMLFADAAVSNPQESLNSLTYAVRTTLKAIGAEQLLEYEGGCYRLRWHEVAFCDLHEAEAFRELALVLQSRGHVGPAALMRAVADAYVAGEPFGGLADALGARYGGLVASLRLGLSSEERA